MSLLENSLWELTLGTPWIDPVELAAALERKAAEDDLDFRTRLLIRDSLNVLLEHWGRPRLEKWLTASKRRGSLEQIWRSDLGPPGFPTLNQRLMTNTNPDDVRQFLRELGNHIGQPERIVVGGSIALILSGQLSRYTEHLDVVDEVPLAIRQEHEVLDEMARRYGLRLAHFESHYLPDEWEQRLSALGDFERLRVDLVDTYDIFVGKLFSPRTKDRDDLRVLSRQLEKAKIEARLRESGMRLLADPTRADNAAKNWYILYGEELPR